MKYGKKYNIGICNAYGVGWGDEVTREVFDNAYTEDQSSQYLGYPIFNSIPVCKEYTINK